MDETKNLSKRFEEPLFDEEVDEFEDIDEGTLSPAPPVNMREAVDQAFNELGGTQGLVTWVKSSEANKRIFYRDMLPKLIPKEHKVTGTIKEEKTLVVKWVGGANDPAKLTEVAEIAEFTNVDE